MAPFADDRNTSCDLVTRRLLNFGLGVPGTREFIRVEGVFLHQARQEETDVLMMPSCTLRAVLKTTSIQINVILGPPLDERIVIIGFRDRSRAEANPYKSADLAFLS